MNISKESKPEKSNLTKAFWSGNRLRFIAAIICGLVMSSANLLCSIVLKEVTDVASGIGGKAEIIKILIKIVLGLIALLPVGIMYSKLRTDFTKKAMVQYKNKVVESIMQKSIGAFGRESVSLYTSGLTNDCHIIEESFIKAMFELAVKIFLFVGALSVMMWFSPLLTVIAIGFSVIPIIVSAMTGRKIAPLEEETSNKNKTYVSIISEALSGFTVVKSFKAEKEIYKYTVCENETLEEVKRKRDFTKNNVILFGVTSGVITQLGVFIVGMILCLKGKNITPGMLISFVNLLNFIVSPIGEIPALLANRKGAHKLIEKMESSLKESNDSFENQEKEPCTHEKGISVKGLSYSYNDDKKVLDGFDFFFEKNKSYALVGASGSGKSTFLQLLLKGIKNYTGEIKYDDCELSGLNPDSLYDTISTIQQNVFVFNASIKDNITMFREFPRKEFEQVVKLAGLDALIKEKGEDYMCGENGAALSGGEKQRISIARALLQNSKVLLVDEATAALDSQNSHKIMNSILGLENMTRIVVTHNLDEGNLKKFDCILTIKNGSLSEYGKFSELMDQKGYFYSLYTVAQQ